MCRMQRLFVPCIGLKWLFRIVRILFQINTDWKRSAEHSSARLTLSIHKVRVHYINIYISFSAFAFSRIAAYTAWDREQLLLFPNIEENLHGILLLCYTCARKSFEIRSWPYNVVTMLLFLIRLSERTLVLTYWNFCVLS